MEGAARRWQVGFTLIELLVVLAIVSTLLLLVTPRYFHKVDATKEAVLRDNLRSVRDVIDKFHADNARYPETLEELVEKRYLRSVPMDPFTESTATWQLVPAPEGYQGALYDLHSGSQGADRHGSKHADW